MRILYVGVSLAVFLLDWWTKTLVMSEMSLGETVPVIRHFIHLTYSQNPGIAFGLFGLNPAPYQNWILIGVSALAIVVIAFLARQYPAQHVWIQSGFALIIGGAAGNLRDRIVHGQVIDFIDVFFHEHHWPLFNVADSAISVGVFGLAVFLIFFEKTGPAVRKERK
jgi:signal peptidase II